MSSRRGRTALITGGGSGIGLEISKALLKSGYDLILHTNSASDGVRELTKAARASGRTIRSLKADFAKRTATKDFIQAIKPIFQKVQIDALIHCAGRNEKKQYGDITWADYDSIFGINIAAPLFVTKNVLDAGAIKKGGSILFIGTPNTYIAGSMRNMLYTASKSGLIGVTHNLAKELSPDIRVNSIVPGFISTRMLKERTDDAALEKKRVGIPMGRFGESKEIADVVTFLLSEKAAYITGQHVHVNGGVFLS